GALALSVSRVQLSILGFLYYELIEPAWAYLQRREQLAQARAEAERQAEERRQIEEREARRQAELACQQAPTVPRTELMRRAIAEGKQDYDSDCDAMRSLGLPRDERKAALLEARRKLLRRVNEVMQ